MASSAPSCWSILLLRMEHGRGCGWIMDVILDGDPLFPSMSPADGEYGMGLSKGPMSEVRWCLSLSSLIRR
jgi:hypothetical protein